MEGEFENVVADDLKSVVSQPQFDDIQLILGADDCENV